MKKIILIISVLLSILIIYSCQETLGINNSKYIKDAMIDTLSHDTLIVDYKKIIITYYLVEHDTIIKYDTIPVTSYPVFTSKYKFTLIEKFINNKGMEMDYILPNINPNKRSASINYNDYLPVLNLDIIIDNSDSDSSSFKQNPFRTELLSKLSLKLDSIQIISDTPQFLNNLYNSNQAELNLTFNKDSGGSLDIGPTEIYGYINMSGRNVIKGQLVSLTFDLTVFIPSLYNSITGDYAVELIVNFIFPVF
jgi:hypothetical protein